MATQIPFKRKLQESGGGVTVNIPAEVIQHKKWKVGDEVCIILDENKRKQEFVAIYKEGE